jgi:hypothetical protein
VVVAVRVDVLGLGFWLVDDEFDLFLLVQFENRFEK